MNKLHSFIIKLDFKMMFMKLIFSMFISTIMLFLSIFELTNDKLTLFIFFTILNYISVDAVLNIFSASVTSFYDKIIGGLYEIEIGYLSNYDMDEAKKEILKFKFIRVKQYFIKSLLSMQFLRTSKYDKEIEVATLKTIAIQTVELYVNDMKNAGLSEDFINIFNKVHDNNTKDFMNAIIESIRNDKITWKRREVLYESLINLMKKTVDDFILAMNDYNKKNN